MNNEPSPGMRAKLARIQRGLKQEDVAPKLGMDRSRLSRIETGAVTNVTPEEQAAFRDVLGIDPLAWVPGPPAPEAASEATT